MKQKHLREAWHIPLIVRLMPGIEGAFVSLILGALLVMEIDRHPGHWGGAPFVDLPQIETPLHSDSLEDLHFVKLAANGTLFVDSREVPPEEQAALFRAMVEKNYRKQRERGRSGVEMLDGQVVSKLVVVFIADRHLGFEHVARVVQAATAEGVYRFAYKLRFGSISMWLPTRDREDVRYFDVCLRHDAGGLHITWQSEPLSGLDALKERVEQFPPRGPDDPMPVLRLKIESGVPVEEFMNVYASVRGEWHNVYVRDERGQWTPFDVTPRPEPGSSAGTQ